MWIFVKELGEEVQNTHTSSQTMAEKIRYGSDTHQNCPINLLIAVCTLYYMYSIQTLFIVVMGNTENLVQWTSLLLIKLIAINQNKIKDV